MHSSPKVSASICRRAQESIDRLPRQSKIGASHVVERRAGQGSASKRRTIHGHEPQHMRPIVAHLDLDHLVVLPLLRTTC